MEVVVMESLKINTSVLPINAQRELYDFYEFLVYKYTNKKKESQNINIDDIIPRRVTPFEPIKRNSIYER
jgi:hypothetical protein